MLNDKKLKENIGWLPGADEFLTFDFKNCKWLTRLQ